MLLKNLQLPWIPFEAFELCPDLFVCVWALRVRPTKGATQAINVAFLDQSTNRPVDQK